MTIQNQVLMPEHSELGKRSDYDPIYNPDKLFPIARDAKRKELGIESGNLPFYGFDCWNHYEASWLNAKGKPVVALAEIIFASDSPNIIESKSMKLYFNSFNNTQFQSPEIVAATIKKDLEKRVESIVSVKVIPLNNFVEEKVLRGFAGICLDNNDIECNVYKVNPAFLVTEKPEVTETVYSDLLKSNCFVTKQPDWGSVQISYHGKKINHTGLLQYIVSFRNHIEFNEQCIERIFMDIMRQCKPNELTVYGRYTRRGGMDINPYRTTKPMDFSGKNVRFCRQ